MIQRALNNALSRPSLRDTTGAQAAGQAWTERRVDQAMDAAANPQRQASQEQQARRRWMGNWVASGSREGYREPGDPFGSQPPRASGPGVDEDELRDAILQRFGERADQEGGFFGTFASDTTRALSARDLDSSVASLRSAMAAKDSLAAAGTTLHSNRQGGSPMATNSTAGLDTVQGQMEDLMSQDNSLMKQARTSALQGANSRGLLNSSMAVGASQNAMARQALPIAQQDAGALQDLNQLQASSAANAWGVMANNVTDIVAQGMEGIANIQANPDIKSSDKTKMIKQITDMRDTDIEFQTGLYQNLSSYLADTGLFPNL